LEANRREEVAMFSGRQEMLETFLLFFGTVGVVALVAWLGYLVAQIFLDDRRQPRPR
jgi:hypothetical protein